MVAPHAQESSTIRKALSYPVALLGVLALTFTIQQLHLDKSPANVPIVYLLVVILSAVFLGQGASILASVSSFLAFNWFFVTPRYTLAVRDPGEWVSLCMFLLTATVTGQLMARLKEIAWKARQHELQSAALAEATLAVASQLETKSALAEVVRQLSKIVDLSAAAVVGTAEGEAPHVMATHPEGAEVPLGSIVGARPLAHEDKGEIWLPIRLSEEILGWVYLKPAHPEKISPEQDRILHALIQHSAIVLQRDALLKKEARATALADADKLKTALLNMISHDFRSPLTTIKASVSTLQSDGQPLDQETQQNLYQAIEQESDRINRIVGNILDLSRLEADAWRPKFEPVALPELIGMALSGFSEEANNRIALKLDTAPTELNVDAVQIAQVLKNLVENALKYSPFNCEVEIQANFENGGASISVLDKGPGISEEDVGHIFEPFYRGALLQETSVPGVGIGLAVCRGLVEAHGGTLTAMNRPDGGAIFQMYLPNVAAAASGIPNDESTGNR